MAEFIATYGAFIATATSATATAVSQVQQGRAAKAQAESEDAWHRYNAEVQERNARAQEAAGRAEELQQRRDAARLQSRQRALLGTAGVEIGEGSPLLVLVNTAAEAEREALTIRENARVAAQGSRSGAELSLLSGQAAKARGRNLSTGSVLQAGGALLSGAGSLAGISYQRGIDKKLLAAKGIK